MMPQTDPAALPPADDGSGPYGPPTMVSSDPVLLEPAAELTHGIQAPDLAPTELPAAMLEMLHDEIARAQQQHTDHAQTLATIDSALSDAIARLEKLERIINGKIANIFARHFDGLE